MSDPLRLPNPEDDREQAIKPCGLYSGVARCGNKFLCGRYCWYNTMPWDAYLRGRRRGE